MKIVFLSSQNCEDKNANNGDCIIIDNGRELVIYDCGCEDYANYVMNYMKENGYEKVKIVLSHNDDDHFKGIPILIEKGKGSEIITVLLLKYREELLKKIDDKRKTKDSIRKQITDMYDNIEKISGNNLKDAFVHTNVADGVKISGPGKDYILDAAAKGLDTTEGDIINGESITNATSIHLKVKFNNKYLLLTGDSNFESIMKENLGDVEIIQLSHHGKKDIAEKIFKELDDKKDVIFIISDNTGNSNGGSDTLDVKGYNVKNTKVEGTISLDDKSISLNSTKGSLNDIFDL